MVIIFCVVVQRDSELLRMLNASVCVTNKVHKEKHFSYKACYDTLMHAGKEEQLERYNTKRTAHSNSGTN